MITGRNLVPGRVLLGTAWIRGTYNIHLAHAALCMVIGLMQSTHPVRRHSRKTMQYDPAPADDGWHVLVAWFDGRCSPQIEEVTIPVDNDWKPAW